MRSTLIVLVALLAGCGSTLERQMKGMEGQPPAFHDGYRAGCASGLKAGGYMHYTFTKDVPRYERERQYADGWEDGFRVCRTWALSGDR